MSTLTDLAKRWNGEIKAECRRQGLRFVADHTFLVDEVYLATLWAGVWVTDIDGVAQICWAAAIKPLVLDEILWVAFMPDVDVGAPRKRLTRRINGAFIVEPLEWAAAPQKRPSVMSSVLASQKK